MVTVSGTEQQTSGFAQRLEARSATQRSWLCIGLDPDPDRFPQGFARNAEGAVALCRAIIEATADFAVCFKINFAFFEAFGPGGWAALHAVRTSVPTEIPVIADAKRGDIANSATAYAAAIFDQLAFDAVTVNPYLGLEALQPFLEYAGRGVLVLCRTSNPSSATIQELQVDGVPLYLHVAREVLAHGGQAEAGLVVGATQPEALRAVRALNEDTVLLLPGVGAQGATVDQALRAGANRDGKNALISVSRQVMYASNGPNFADAARHAARSLARETVQPV